VCKKQHKGQQMNKLSLLSLSIVSFFSAANDPVSYTLRAHFKQNYYMEEKKLEDTIEQRFNDIKKEVYDPKTKKINKAHPKYQAYIIKNQQDRNALKTSSHPDVQEQRYRERVAASNINQQRIAMDAELKKATIQRELQLKEQNIVKGSAEFDQTKSAWKKDLKQIRAKYKAEDNRWQRHQQILIDAKISSQDMGNTGSRPNSIQSDLDLTPKTKKYGEQYVKAYQQANANSFVEERSDRWILHDTDTVVWKAPVTKTLGSSSYDSEIAFRAQKNSDAFSTTGGLNFTSGGQLGIRDNEGAVLANANKFSDAIDPKHRDLSTAAKSVYKSQDASGRIAEVDAKFRAQLEIAYQGKGTPEEVFDSFGDSADEKLTKEESFYQKAEQDISKSYQTAENQTKEQQVTRKKLEDKLVAMNDEVSTKTDFSAEYNQMDNSDNYRPLRDANNNITGYQKIPATSGNASTKAVIAIETVSIDEMKKITINKVRQDRVTINAENQATLTTLVDRDPSFTHQLKTGKAIVEVTKKGNIVGYKDLESGKIMSISEAKAPVKGNSEASLLYQIKNGVAGKSYKGINVIGDLLDIKKSVTKGVNRALDEEQAGDSALKTWAKATSYGVWENSSIKGLLDGAKQTDKNISSAIDKQAKADRESGLTSTIAGSYLSFLKGVAVVGKNSGEFALNMAWGMTVGAAESVGSAIGENLEELTRDYNIDEKEQYAELVEFKAQQQSYLLSIAKSKIVKDVSAVKNDMGNETKIVSENTDEKDKLAIATTAAVKLVTNDALPATDIANLSTDLTSKSTDLSENSAESENVDDLFAAMKSSAEIDNTQLENELLSNEQLNNEQENNEQLNDDQLTDELLNNDAPAVENSNEDDEFWDVDTVSTSENDDAWEARQQVAYEAQMSAQGEENSVSQHQQGIKGKRDQSRREFAQGMKTLAQGVAQVAIKAQQESMAINQQVAANNAKFANLLNSSSKQQSMLDACMSRNKSSNPYADINALRYRCSQQVSTSSSRSNSSDQTTSSTKIAAKAVKRPPIKKVSYATKTYFTVIIAETGSVSTTFEAIDKQYGVYRYADNKGRRYYADSSIVAEIDEINKYRREGKIQIRSKTESVVLVDNCIVPSKVYQRGVQQMAKTKSKLNGQGYQTSRQTWGGAECD
jgi:hypothetical protein